MIQYKVKGIQKHFVFFGYHLVFVRYQPVYARYYEVRIWY